jgi:hypothetical protein
MIDTLDNIKLCSNCKEIKSLNEFYKSKKNLTQPYCKSCCKQSSKLSYLTVRKNKEKTSIADRLYWSSYRGYLSRKSKGKNLIKLKEQRPQLYKRLVNWGLKRKNTWGILYHKHIEEVESEVNYYLDELVFTPTTFSQAYSNLTKWDNVLTDKEKQAVGLLFPFVSEVAVCKLITEGYKPIDDKFKEAISYHDKVTKALESKDLILV